MLWIPFSSLTHLNRDILVLSSATNFLNQRSIWLVIVPVFLYFKFCSCQVQQSMRPKSQVPCSRQFQLVNPAVQMMAIWKQRRAIMKNLSIADSAHCESTAWYSNSLFDLTHLSTWVWRHAASLQVKQTVDCFAIQTDANFKLQKIGLD